MYQIHHADIMDWLKEGQLTKDYWIDKNRGLVVSFVSLVFGLRLSMAGRTEGYKVGKIVCFQIGIEQPKRYFMMRVKNLTKFLNALFCVHTAILTGPIVSPFCFTLLGLPVWAVPVGAVPVNILRVIFPASMSVAASSATVFSSALFSTQATSVDFKIIIAIKADALYRMLAWSVFNNLILAFRRAILTAPVLEPTRNDVKDLAAILADSFDCLFHYCSKIKLPRRPGAVVEAATQKAFGGANRIIANIWLNKNSALLGKAAST